MRVAQAEHTYHVPLSERLSSPIVLSKKVGAMVDVYAYALKQTAARESSDGVRDQREDHDDMINKTLNTNASNLSDAKEISWPHGCVMKMADTLSKSRFLRYEVIAKGGSLTTCIH